LRHGKCDESIFCNKTGNLLQNIPIKLTFARNSPTIIYLLIGCPFLAQCTLSWLAVQSALNTTCIARGIWEKGASTVAIEIIPHMVRYESNKRYV
jgi:hypothetical protein